MTRWIRPLSFCLTAAVCSAPLAEPTQITVHVIGKDSKFVGTSMGGMRITIRDADSGAILADGVTAGSTGDTNKLMKEDRKRGVAISTDDAARYTATIDLSEPRLLEISAFGPLAQRQSATRVTVTQWVVPGKHITSGDGLMLELPGFVVDVLGPPAHVKLKGVPQTVNVAANVMMMCGCPTSSGGMWDSNKYEVRALLKKDGQAAGELPLAYTGKESQFAADWNVTEPGTYQATVYAYDPANGNTGVDNVTFVVAK
jgi:hypothetical protein